MPVEKEDASRHKQRVPYLRYAFHNFYNYTAMGGFAAAALLTQNWWLALVGGGVEVLWMAFAPDSKTLRTFWFDKTHAENLAAEAKSVRTARLATLPDAHVQRVQALESKHAEILRLCNENRAFTAELLRGELAKLDHLSNSFLELMISSIRHEEYLATVHLQGLEADMDRHRTIAETSKDGERQRLALKNLEVLTQRREKLAEIRRFIGTAHGQMDLIENTFRLLADQIVTMRSPRELGGQLDELIGGVEAVRTTARETETLFERSLA